LNYSLIENNLKLETLCGHLAKEPELAMDLEADSLHHYREKVCLLQLSNRTDTWLIDPFAISDISPLSRLLAEPERLIVFHGGDYDIRSLHRDFRITVNRMFDTMIAAQFTGATEFGLAALLRENFGIELDKRFQKADWSKRPLTLEMADYAANDTANLLRLADILRNKLGELNRSGWVEEECALVTTNRVQNRSDTSLFMHCKGAGRLTPRQLAILEELLQLRELQASEMDRPVFKVIPSEPLMFISEKQLQNIQDMYGVPGLTTRLLNQYGTKLVEAVKRGMNLSERDLPSYPRYKTESTPGIKTRLSRLKQWREGYSKQIGLPTGIIAPNWLLERIAEHNPSSIERLAELQGIRQWQVNLWGKDMLILLAKENQPK